MATDKAWQKHISTIKALAGRITDGLPKDHLHGHRLSRIAGELGASAEALAGMYATPDPTVTVAAHEKRVIQAASKLKDQAGRNFDEMQNAYRTALADVDNRIDAKVNLKADPAAAAEVRAAFRALPKGEQAGALQRLALANDGPTLAAIVDASPFLTGVDPELAGRFKDLAVTTHARPEAEERTAIQAAFDTALGVYDAAKATAALFSDPARLAGIERGEQAAADAERTFNASVNSRS